MLKFESTYESGVQTVKVHCDKCKQSVTFSTSVERDGYCEARAGLSLAQIYHRAWDNGLRCNCQ